MIKGYGIGRLTKDIELSYSAAGTAYMSNSIASDRKYSKDAEKKTDFFNIKVFGKNAENMSSYLHKGSKILVEGHFQNDEYTTKDGVKKSNMVLYVDSWEFAENKGDAAKEQKANDFVNVPEGLVEELPFS